MTSLQILRAVNHRLVSTNADELPRLAGFLSTSISSCSGLLNEAGKKDNDNNLQLNKLKTRVSSLLQDRTQEGRFTGILLTKLIVEAGSVAGLSELGAWVRSLLSCLNKPDTPEVKKLCLITLTRIYILVADNPSLIREIVTPTLPTFISTSINLVRPVATIPGPLQTRVLSPLLPPILRCWCQLVKRFPTTFRPHAATIRSISLSLISDDSCPQTTKQMACDVISRLHFCATKNVMPSEWSQFCDELIEAAHEVCDHVFRPFIEDWSSPVARNSKLTEKGRAAGEVSMTSIDAVGMESWTGLSRGCSKLTSLIDILRSVLINTHFLPIKFPISKIIDLCGRISAVTLPTSKFALKANPEVTRDEREELCANLPYVHAVILGFLQTLMQTLGAVLLPVASTISSQIWDIFEAEQAHRIVREASYRSLESLLCEGLASHSQNETSNLAHLIKACCMDLKLESGLAEPVYKPDAKGQVLEASSINSKTNMKYKSGLHQSRLFNSAYSLLPAILTHAPIHFLSSTSRALLDSTSILLNHQEAMLASVLNPPKSHDNFKALKSPGPSILPFLAVSKVHSLATEALLRPRLPPIQVEQLEVTVHDGNIRESDAMETDRDENDRTDRISEDDVRSLTNDHPVLDEPIADLPPVQRSQQESQHERHAASQLKRDFSSIVQRSTDEQNNVPHERGDEEGKRIRLISDESDLNSFRQRSPNSRIAGTQIEHASTGPSQPFKSAELNVEGGQFPSPSVHGDNSGGQVTPIASESFSGNKDNNESNLANSGGSEVSGSVSTAQHVASLEELGKDGDTAAAGEDDDESDFEMPTIDTTLSTSDEEEE